MSQKKQWIPPTDLLVGDFICGWRSHRNGKVSEISDSGEDPIVVTEIKEVPESGEMIVEPGMGNLNGFDWLILTEPKHQMILHSEDVIIGDVLIGCIHEDGTKADWNRTRVAKIEPTYWDLTSVNGEKMVCPNYGIGHTTNNKKFFFRIIRESHHPVAMAKAAVENRYPHLCPSCGGRAYLGLFSVEHEQAKGNCINR